MEVTNLHETVSLSSTIYFEVVGARGYAHSHGVHFVSPAEVRSDARLTRTIRVSGTTSKQIHLDAEAKHPLAIEHVYKNGREIFPTSDYTISYSVNGITIINLVADRLTSDDILVIYKVIFTDDDIIRRIVDWENYVLGKLYMYDKTDLLESPVVSTIVKHLVVGHIIVEINSGGSKNPSNGFWNYGDRLIKEANATLDSIIAGERHIINAEGEIIKPTHAASFTVVGDRFTRKRSLSEIPNFKERLTQCHG